MHYINQAIKQLQRTKGIEVVKISSVYETKPVGGPKQADFLNAVLEIETALSPRHLLEAAKNIEQKLGRKPDEKRWGPRIIDIDILLYGDLYLESKPLVIPHPQMHKRLFMLVPFCEIAPDVVHPRLEKTIKQLKAAVKDISDESVKKYT